MKTPKYISLESDIRGACNKAGERVDSLINVAMHIWKGKQKTNSNIMSMIRKKPKNRKYNNGKSSSPPG
jgi:hypothetical protein